MERHSSEEINVVLLFFSQIISEAVHKYREASSKSLEDFYGEERSVTFSYLARTILDILLKISSSQCNVN